MLPQRGFSSSHTVEHTRCVYWSFFLSFILCFHSSTRIRMPNYVAVVNLLLLLFIYFDGIGIRIFETATRALSKKKKLNAASRQQATTRERHNDRIVIFPSEIWSFEWSKQCSLMHNHFIESLWHKYKRIVWWSVSLFRFTYIRSSIISGQYWNI